MAYTRAPIEQVSICTITRITTETLLAVSKDACVLKLLEPELHYQLADIMLTLSYLRLILGNPHWAMWDGIGRVCFNSKYAELPSFDRSAAKSFHFLESEGPEIACRAR
jgi:hypothetical protein